MFLNSNSFTVAFPPLRSSLHAPLSAFLPSHLAAYLSRSVSPGQAGGPGPCATADGHAAEVNHLLATRLEILQEPLHPHSELLFLCILPACPDPQNCNRQLEQPLLRSAFCLLHFIPPHAHPTPSTYTALGGHTPENILP